MNADLFARVGGANRIATFSPCRRYRYRLDIIWNDENPGRLVALLLNPSTADEFKDDPTVARVCRRAKHLGLGGAVILNAFAWRDTDPRKMKAAEDPVGPDNDATLMRTLHEAAQGDWPVMAGWGAHGGYRNRGAQVKALAIGQGVQLQCLKVTAGGHPQHPLYCGNDWALQPYP